MLAGITMYADQTLTCGEFDVLKLVCTTAECDNLGIQYYSLGLRLPLADMAKLVNTRANVGFICWQNVERTSVSDKTPRCEHPPAKLTPAGTRLVNPGTTVDASPLLLWRRCVCFHRGRTHRIKGFTTARFHCMPSAPQLAL